MSDIGQSGSDARGTVRVAHVVRDYGGLTEPFIAGRIAADPDAAELWSERVRGVAGTLRLRHVRVPLHGPGSLLDRALHRDPRLARALAEPVYRRVDRAARPDLVHAHYLSTAALIVGAVRGPLVVSTYGFDASVLPRRRGWRAALRRATPHFASVLVEGPAMAARVIALGVPAERVRIVPISAGHEQVAFEPPRSPGPPFRLLACGRLVEKKGLELAVEAVSRLRADGLPVSLRIVGDGPRRTHLERLVTERRLGDAVTLLGSLPRDVYLREVRDATILLAPSVAARNGDTEGGAPTTILDAQASGTPVIGSTHADIPFLVEDGVTGWLFEEGRADALAEAIQRAIAASGTWPDVAREARARVEQRHGQTAQRAALRSLTEELVGR